MDFKQWLKEDCGEDFARGNKGPFAKARSNTADDEEIPWELRGNPNVTVNPESLFGSMKKMKKKMKRR